MTLLQALERMMSGTQKTINARIVHFAFTENDVAFLSEITTEELIPMLEDWCRKQRKIDRQNIVEEIVH